jgi:hypothetical protein
MHIDLKLARLQSKAEHPVNNKPASEKTDHA